MSWEFNESWEESGYRLENGDNLAIEVYEVASNMWRVDLATENMHTSISLQDTEIGCFLLLHDIGIIEEEQIPDLE